MLAFDRPVTPSLDGAVDLLVQVRPIFYSSRASTWHKLLILFGVG